MLEPVAENLWVKSTYFALPKGLLPFGIPGFIAKCRIRMTVIRFNRNDLLLHSPVQPKPEWVAAVKELGSVRWIVGPNTVHNTYLLAWKNLFPDATLVVAPKTGKRIPELGGFDEITDKTPIVGDELKQETFWAHRSYETVFLHVPSKTMIATDMIYHIPPTAPLTERVYYKVFRAFGRPGICSYHKYFIRDKDLFWKSLEKVFEWDFDRLIMSHGDIVEKDGKKEFKRAWIEFRDRYF